MKTNDINKLLELQDLINKKFDLLIKSIEQPTEFEQNTINDFYECTTDMIYDLFNLSSSKLYDALEEGQLYTRTNIMEVYGQVVKYVMVFVVGEDFIKK